MSSSSGSWRSAQQAKAAKADPEQGRGLLASERLPRYSAFADDDVAPPPHDAPPAYTPFPEDEKFDPAPRYSDSWATLLFIAHLAAFAAVAATSIPAIDFGSAPGDGQPVPKGSFTLLLVAVGAGAIASLGYFALMMKYAATLITTGFLLNIIYNFGIAVFFLVSGSFGAGMIWAVLAVIFGAIWWSWRSRIPFATVMLESVTDILAQFPGTTLAAVSGLLVNVAWLGLWTITVFGVIVRYQNSGQEALAALFVFMAFSFYWTTQVISNVVHVTISGSYNIGMAVDYWLPLLTLDSFAGVVATYYFLGSADPAGKVTVPVSNPTGSSFKRAMTTSFGPIAFGSLLVSLLETTRGLVNAAAHQAARDDHQFAAFLLLCLRSLLDIIDDLFRYFNRYAYATVAVYGKSFCESAKTTWRMVLERGVDAVVGDSLINSVLGIGSTFIGFLTASIVVAATSLQPDLGLEWCKFLDANGDPEQCQLAVVSISGVVAFFIGVVEFAVLSGVSLARSSVSFHTR